MTEGAHSGGHFKLILALGLIAAIMGLIVYANAGDKIMQALKVGKFTETQAPPPEEPFGVSLKTAATALYGKSFTIATSPFSFEGVCSTVSVGGLKFETEETRCSASSDSFTGTFQYTPFGSILITGNAPSVKVNSIKYSSAAPTNFEFEVIPTTFSIDGLTTTALSIIAPTGSIEKYARDGSLVGVAYLTQSTLDINSLVASAQLKEGQLTVTGTATSVTNEEFSW